MTHSLVHLGGFISYLTEVCDIDAFDGDDDRFLSFLQKSITTLPSYVVNPEDVALRVGNVFEDLSHHKRVHLAVLWCELCLYTHFVVSDNYRALEKDLNTWTGLTQVERGQFFPALEYHENPEVPLPFVLNSQAEVILENWVTVLEASTRTLRHQHRMHSVGRTVHRGAVLGYHLDNNGCVRTVDDFDKLKNAIWFLISRLPVQKRSCKLQRRLSEDHFAAVMFYAEWHLAGHRQSIDAFQVALENHLKAIHDDERPNALPSEWRPPLERYLNRIKNSTSVRFADLHTRGSAPTPTTEGDDQ